MCSCVEKTSASKYTPLLKLYKYQGNESCNAKQHLNRYSGVIHYLYKLQGYRERRVSPTVLKKTNTKEIKEMFPVRDNLD